MSGKGRTNNSSSPSTRKLHRGVGSTALVLWRAILLVTLLFIVLPGLAIASDGAQDVVFKFTEAILAGKHSAVMELIHPEFNSEIGDRKAFEGWLRKWFEWDDDYIFQAGNLSVNKKGEVTEVKGTFRRAWLMGIHADDVDISQEGELTEALEEEGGSVQKVEKTAEITFTLKEDGGKLKIVRITGMDMYDPMSAVVGSRDPRAKKIGQALSGLTKIPLIGGLFNPSEKEFEKGKKGLIIVVSVVGALFALFIGIGAAKTQFDLAVLSAHSFPEGVGYHTQYSAFSEFRERIQQGSTERRHDYYLRSLIDEGKFEDAKSYVEGMIVYCQRRKDKHASATYQSYKLRVEQLHEEHKLKEKTLSEEVWHEKTERDVHKILGDKPSDT